MKTFAVLSIAAICLVASAFGHDHRQGLTDQQKAELKKFSSECVAESKVDEVLVEHLRHEEQMLDNDELKCFSACLLKKHEIMRPNGSIDSETMGKKLIAGTSGTIVDVCKSEVGQNQCETGAKVLDCLIKNHAISI